MNAKFVFSLALAAALPALADVTTANVIGVLRVDSSAAETIVSVPWVATSAAAEDTAIPVTDIVKTAGLSEGDELQYYNSSTGKYQCWRLEGGAWTAATPIGENGELASEGATLARGDAIILKRKTNIQDHFYLQGQVAQTGSVTMTMAQGSATAPAYSLIAPPTDKAVKLNDGTWTGVNAKDRIILKGKMYVSGVANGKTVWGTITTDPKTFVDEFVPAADTVTIAAGEGAWFVRAAGASGEAQVIWNDLPAVGAAN